MRNATRLLHFSDRFTVLALIVIHIVLTGQHSCSAYAAAVAQERGARVRRIKGVPLTRIAAAQSAAPFGRRVGSALCYWSLSFPCDLYIEYH